jgi:enoyl-CoA hydratase
MNLENVTYEVKEDIGTITINRPQKKNALNRATRLELRKLLEEIRSGKELRILIITGAGQDAFIAGADIPEMKEMNQWDMMDNLSTLSQQLYTDFGNLEIPVIAMINGYCFGGGLELALACDIRIASEDASFGQPEIRLGIMPGGGATQRLPGLVGPAIAKELMFTGRIIDAQEALRIGLVNRVVPKDKLNEAVWELARDIAKKSPIALKLIKRSVNRGGQAPSDVGLAYEALAECLCFTTEDHEEGLSAFLEKRKPNFRGK